MSSATPAAFEADDGLLHIEDVQGKRIVATRLRGNVTIREENATAALEAMSRFGADPRWLIYLPPTMVPTETSRREGYLAARLSPFGSPPTVSRRGQSPRVYERAGIDDCLSSARLRRPRLHSPRRHLRRGITVRIP